MKTAWFAKAWPWIAVVAILAVVGVALFFVLRNDKAEEQKFDEALSTAGQFTDVGDYDQALAALRQAQNDAQGTGQQLIMLSNLAATAANAGKLSEALDYYTQKHELDPSAAAADGLLVGEIYERQGETQKAIEQYETYLVYITNNPTDEDNQARIDSVNARIQQLKEGV